MCALAARSGSLEVLRWVQEQGCARNEDTVRANAVAFSQVEVLTWLDDNGGM
jgi:hypothetical protein